MPSSDWSRAIDKVDDEVTEGKNNREEENSRFCEVIVLRKLHFQCSFCNIFTT